MNLESVCDVEEAEITKRPRVNTILFAGNVQWGIETETVCLEL